MKKRPVYLYILLTLSTLGSLISAWGTFGASKTLQLTGEQLALMGLETAKDQAAYKLYYEKIVEAQQSPLVYLLLSLVLIGLGVVYYFLYYQRDLQKANLAFVGQVVCNLLLTFYSHLMTRSLVSLLPNEGFQNLTRATLSGSLMVSVLVAAVYLVILLYKTWRFQKEAQEDQD